MCVKHTEDVFLLSNESWEPEAINILPRCGGREVPHDGQYKPQRTSSRDFNPRRRNSSGLSLDMFPSVIQGLETYFAVTSGLRPWFLTYSS